MKWCLFVIALALTGGCSGSTTPTTPTTTATTIVSTPALPAPIPSANLAMVDVFDLPGCQAGASLAVLLHLSTVTCPAFTGTVSNTGPGCATNVHGITTIFFNGTSTVVGTAGWTYASTVRAGEQIVYRGASITVPSSGGFGYRTTPSWDNVRCQ